MRMMKKLQLFLRHSKVETEWSAEVEEIGKILKEAPGIEKVYEQVLSEVTGGKQTSTGAEGLSAEQIVMLGLLRVRKDLSYRELSELTGDSIAVRALLNVKYEAKISKSAINSNLKKVSESTWQMLNDSLLQLAKKDEIESGNQTRTDTTTSKTNIHWSDR